MRFKWALRSGCEAPQWLLIWEKMVFYTLAIHTQIEPRWGKNCISAVVGQTPHRMLQTPLCIANDPLHCIAALMMTNTILTYIDWDISIRPTLLFAVSFVFAKQIKRQTQWQRQNTSNTLLTEVRLRDFRQTCFVICLSDGCRSWSRDRSFERRPAIFVSSVVIIIVKHHLCASRLYVQSNIFDTHYIKLIWLILTNKSHLR